MSSVTMSGNVSSVKQYAYVLRAGGYEMTSFFFFQAEDGIRDFHVTGVQTCALPICADGQGRGGWARWWRVARRSTIRSRVRRGPVDGHRSEERRVGKECRSRWS